MQDRFAPHPQSEVSDNQAGLEQRAKKAIESVGINVKSITLIPEGRSHNVFEVSTASDLFAIARFEKSSPDEIRRDSQFNGPLTLGRERQLMILTKEIGLPAPVVYSQYETEQGNFLLVEKMPGVHWSEYIAQNNYSKEAYLKSLRFLGNDIADAHSVQFTSFGDVMGKDSVHPGTITNFMDRVNMITALRIGRARQSQAINDEELNSIESYLHSQSNLLSEMIKNTSQRPALLLTDLHPMNFFVDQSGKPSGFFDLEACQAGHPALEIYNLRTHVLNYFDGISDEAEWEFITGYEENGGRYNPTDLTNRQLEHVLGVGYLVAAATAYYNANDGLRDAWSDQLKRILNDSMESGRVDFQAISGVFRTKTKQPQFPTLP